MKNTISVIALDLEGTLISNAISQTPRPYLHAFLDGCREITVRIVMFTTVSEERFRQIAQLLVSEGVAPEWFASMEYIHWCGHKKDLSFIPDAKIDSTVLVDDVAAYVADGQESHWVSIEQFASPSPDSDCKLLGTLTILRAINTKD